MIRILGVRRCSCCAVRGRWSAPTAAPRLGRSTIERRRRDRPASASSRLGAGLVIITGGIDLSIGSVVGLRGGDSSACSMVDGVAGTRRCRWCSCLGALIGAGATGCSSPGCKLQAFLVTLCGLFIYRGMARRCMTRSRPTNVGRWLKHPASQRDLFGLPTTRLVFRTISILVVGLLAPAIFLHLSVYGRYSQCASAATSRRPAMPESRRIGYKILAFVICCSMLAALFIGFCMSCSTKLGPARSGTGQHVRAVRHRRRRALVASAFEAGKGACLGIIIGTSHLWSSCKTSTNMWGVSTTLGGTVIGVALLLGATLDEFRASVRGERSDSVSRDWRSGEPRTQCLAHHRMMCASDPSAPRCASRLTELCSSRMRSMRRSGSAAPHSSWSPTVNAPGTRGPSPACAGGRPASSACRSRPPASGRACVASRVFGTTFTHSLCGGDHALRSRRAARPSSA